MNIWMFFSFKFWDFLKENFYCDKIAHFEDRVSHQNQINIHRPY